MQYKQDIEYFVYIMSNKLVTILYVGSTNNLIKRDWQHRYKLVDNSFTQRYNINKLLYFEKYPTRKEAYEREKQIKGWKRDKKINLKRDKKINLIRNMNPRFQDLSEIWRKGRL